MTNPAASTPNLATPLPVPPVPPPPSGCSAVSPLASSGCTSVHLPAAVLSAMDRLQDTVDHAARLGSQAVLDAAKAVVSACVSAGIARRYWGDRTCVDSWSPETRFIQAKLTAARDVCHRLCAPMLDALEAACRALSTPPLFLAK